jgi:hypothetical protein
MGDRGDVTIDDKHSDGQVVLYTHWHASKLPGVVAEALSLEERWNDGEYLARIIFDRISELAGGVGETTGAGIGPEIHTDAWRVLTVDIEAQTVTFEADHGYTDDSHAGESYSFEEFVETFDQ